MNEEQSLVLVRYWWSKAEASLISAKREYEAESYSFAMNRLYYSVGCCSANIVTGKCEFMKKRQIPLENLNSLYQYYKKTLNGRPDEKFEYLLSGYVRTGIFRIKRLPEFLNRGNPRIL